MKKFLFLIVSSLVLLMWSCNSQKEDSSAPPPEIHDHSHPTHGFSGSALDYNNEIVTMQGDILEGLFHLTSTFSQGIPDSMWASHSRYLLEVDQIISRAEELPDFEGNTEMRDGALELFRFYRSTGDKEYRRMVELMCKEDLTEAEIVELGEMGQSMAAREGRLDSAFAVTQLNFAKQYGLELVENEMQGNFETDN